MQVAQEKTVLLERTSEYVAVARFNRPEVHNAWNNALIVDLEAVVNELSHDRDLRVVVFTGAGDKSFAAGADINEFKTRTPLMAFQNSRRRQALLQRVEDLPQVSIAAINGYAFGGGCEFALCCGLRVASSKAKMGLPEVKLGLMPGIGGTQRLPRLVGRGRALDLIVTGRTVDAEEAYRIGLVDRLVPHESLLDEALALADEIASRAPVAVHLARKAIDASFDGSFHEGTTLESAFIALCFAGDDIREGIAAFDEKRPPRFSGA